MSQKVEIGSTLNLEFPIVRMLLILIDDDIVNWYFESESKEEKMALFTYMIFIDKQKNIENIES